MGRDLTASHPPRPTEVVYPGGAMSRYDDTDSVDWQQPAGRGRRRTGRSRRYTRGMKITGSLAIMLTAALVFGSLYAYTRYRDVWDSINRVDVGADLAKRPAGFGNALNILLIGSDSRSGGNGGIRGGGGPRPRPAPRLCGGNTT